MELLSPCLGAFFLLLGSVADASTFDHGNNITGQAATELILTYAYPLLAFQAQYLPLSKLLEVNNIGHARQLSTPASRYVVKPNVDTLYSTTTFDISDKDLSIVIPTITDDQYALVSFHDLYGYNFAVLGKSHLARTGNYRLSHAQDVYGTEGGNRNGSSIPSDEGTIQSPTTYGTVLVR